MGEAKLRGSFEQRKAQAIEEGRIKIPKKKIRHDELIDEILRDIYDTKPSIQFGIYDKFGNFWPALL